jgi:hypothetical protein
MAPLVQDVLVGFVTPSDPGTDRGPANIITVAKAKLPQALYLFHTHDTQANVEALKNWIQSDPDLAKAKVETISLDLPDPTNYEKLASLLKEELKKLSKKHPGAQFHLVSGLPQVRIIFALCLYAQILPGTLWEVKSPPPARAFQPPPPQKLDKNECEKRLERWPTSIFEDFRDLLLKRLLAIRLRINVKTEQAWLDDELLDLRPSTHRRGEAGPGRPRTFQTLVLLAAKKRYGGGNDEVPKKLILQTAYRGQTPRNAAVNIRRTLDSLNRQARRITGAGKRAPLDPFVIDVVRRNRVIGVYRLTHKLDPADETIEFEGDLWDYLLKMGLSPGDLRSLFPELYPSAERA